MNLRHFVILNYKENVDVPPGIRLQIMILSCLVKADNFGG